MLSRYIGAHNVQNPEIWTQREVTLTADLKLTPVLVGVWDNGVDVSVFGDRIFTDPHPTASGAHGLAYDHQGNPSESWLFQLTPAQRQQYMTPSFRKEFQGFFDVDDGVNSPEAKAFREKFSTLTPDEIHEFFETAKIIQRYAHGTHVAGIAVRGNPAARVVIIRFDLGMEVSALPPTEDWARRIGADYQGVSEYLNTRNVRVVNMSWGVTPQDFELWLSRTTNAVDPAMRTRQATELFNIWREALENAIKNAPNTLFVCSAGNSDSDARFIQHVPSAFHLPNLIAVAAVNQAGDETSFTSYGSTVVVYADGYQVESSVPGGGTLRGSGTSMASPNVANLAAKLFALDSILTPEEVIDLIKRGATNSEDGRRHLIDEKRSVALLRDRVKN